jgi:hypothetical protein
MFKVKSKFFENGINTNVMKIGYLENYLLHIKKIAANAILFFDYHIIFNLSGHVYTFNASFRIKPMVVIPSCSAN